jgi:glutathione S-transferase
MLEETGVPYEIVRIGFDGVRKPEYLAVNPNGKMPALRDGELVMWESMAINLYLAERYGGRLWPSRIEDRAAMLKWTFWAVNEIEESVFAIFTNRVANSPSQRNESMVIAAEEELKAPLAILDGALRRSTFLLGAAFSAADLNVASILSSVLLADVSLAAYPNVQRWLKASLGRPFPVTTFGALLQG